MRRAQQPFAILSGRASCEWLVIMRAMRLRNRMRIRLEGGWNGLGQRSALRLPALSWNACPGSFAHSDYGNERLNITTITIILPFLSLRDFGFSLCAARSFFLTLLSFIHSLLSFAHNAPCSLQARRRTFPPSLSQTLFCLAALRVGVACTAGSPWQSNWSSPSRQTIAASGTATL